MATHSGNLRVSDLRARLNAKTARERCGMSNTEMLVTQLVMLCCGLLGLAADVSTDLQIMLGAAVIAVPGGWCAEVIEARKRKVPATREERSAKWVFSILFTASMVPVVLRYGSLDAWPSTVVLASLILSGCAWSSALLMRAAWLKFQASALGKWLGLDVGAQGE